MHYFLCSLPDLPQAALRILGNMTFLFVSLSYTAECAIVTAFITFIPKFIESQFGIPASNASIYTGKDCLRTWFGWSDSLKDAHSSSSSSSRAAACEERRSCSCFRDRSVNLTDSSVMHREHVQRLAVSMWSSRDTRIPQHHRLLSDACCQDTRGRGKRVVPLPWVPR